MIFINQILKYYILHQILYYPSANSKAEKLGLCLILGNTYDFNFVSFTL